MDVHLIVSESRFIQRCPQDDDVTWFRLPWPCVAGLRRVLGQQSPDDLKNLGLTEEERRMVMQFFDEACMA